LNGREAGQWAFGCACCRGNAGGRAKTSWALMARVAGAETRERTIGARDPA